MRTHRRFLIVLSSLALVAAACGNAGEDSADEQTDGTEAAANVDDGEVSDAADDEFVAVDQPGVTDDTITVSGVASVTNPLGAPYGQVWDGVDAYFAMINDEGGIYQRDLVLPEDNRHDDQFAQNQTEVQRIITQDDPFAVVGVATLNFAGADLLVDENIPTFGWNIQQEWQNGPNLFGEKGSFLDFTGGGPLLPFLARETGAEKIGVLAYNVPQSSDCLTGIENSFDEYGADAGAEVAFADSSLAYGTTDLSVQVQQMKDAGVDLVTTCMDTNGVTTLAREMERQGLDAPQYLPNGYDYDLIGDFGDLFEGSYVLTGFTPFEFEPQPQGIQDYLQWVDETGGTVGELSLAGWLSAAQFVTGLRAAGPDFTRDKVVDGLNAVTDFTGDGIVAGTDWTIAHEADGPQLCYALSQIQDGEFVPSFTTEGKPFICFDNGAASLPDEPDHQD
ncbi:MAG: ABC transporter substrate-binding protein [Acidimicrobiales bacterium]|nr:ABC transporter substrate-binding protein [Acidimicrobiales bacterium]